MGTIKDKVIMITGASSGFGKITAEKCVSLGAKVILGARRKDRLEELCKQFGSENSVYEVTDVSKKETVDNLASKGIDSGDGLFQGDVINVKPCIISSSL